MLEKNHQEPPSLYFMVFSPFSNKAFCIGIKFVDKLPNPHICVAVLFKYFRMTRTFSRTNMMSYYACVDGICYIHANAHQCLQCYSIGCQSILALVSMPLFKWNTILLDRNVLRYHMKASINKLGRNISKVQFSIFNIALLFSSQTRICAIHMEIRE